MKLLFLTEWRRYQRLAGLLVLLHLFLWTIMSNFVPTMMMHPMKQLFLLALPCVGGIAFGLISMGLHRRKNHWTFLVHRPVSIARIHLAISLANICFLFCVVCLPILLVFGFVDLSSNQVVDIRHYLTVLHLFALAICSYFFASYALLSPAKASFMALWTLLLVQGGVSLPLWQIAIIDMSFIALSFYLAHKSFQINTDSLLKNKGFVLASVLVLQPFVLIILMAASGLYYHLPLAVMGDHPNNNESLNSYQNFISKDRDQSFQQLVSLSDHPDKQTLYRQLSLSEFQFISYKSLASPRFQQLFTVAKDVILVEANQEIQWVLSHDKRVFIGRHNKTDNIVGYMGTTGFYDTLEQLTESDKFEQAVIVTDNQFLQSGRQIYQVNFADRKLVLKHQLPAGEYYTKPIKNMFERTVIQSNKATYLFEQVDFYFASKQLTPQHRVTHPNNLPSYQEVILSEMQDGFLIRYLDPHFYGYLQPGAQLKYVHHDGEIDTLVSYAFTESHVPTVIAGQTFVMSPFVMNIVNGLVPSQLFFANEPYHPYQYVWQRELSLSLLLWIIAGVLTAILGTLVLAKYLAWSKQTCMFWLGLMLIFSLPGFIALLFLYSLPLFRLWRTNRNNSPKARLNTSFKEQRYV
ncbi:hypothetical protein [Thalassotalea marina]|uniref:Uncharacterized protein n=1 Tax=Thalassotalea marina TaxID=1673741 RepID=A0A919BG52_9GAMM|nr:hypothetical protein [Thalassotalea marina]GHF89323.1 hypothetical protein GCM10017161_16450 [Thalassotalea marina]